MSKLSDMRCRLCNRNADEIQGYLTRVNEKGVDPIWECRPDCSAKMSSDARVLAAITEGLNGKLD